MSDYPLIIIGGGLSGLAAGIRYARFDQKVLLLEQHSKLGGLNSYYFRNGIQFETGLHAVTNFAPAGEKRAPLNRLLRQIKLSRDRLDIHQQMGSETLFVGQASLYFTNDIKVLIGEIDRQFPALIDRFLSLIETIKEYDPFKPLPRVSARKKLIEVLGDKLLVDMILCPLMFYGSAEENDMDLAQFVIMFRAIFLEGMFRPGYLVKDLLEMLHDHYRSFGGEIRMKTGVAEILTSRNNGKNNIKGVRLQNGEEITCDCLLSTIGYPETLALLPEPIESTRSAAEPRHGRLSFTESIYMLPWDKSAHLHRDRTIIFYNLADTFHYQRPDDYVGLQSGVICFPDNFEGLPVRETRQLRITHIANYEKWKEADRIGKDAYNLLKKEWADKSKEIVGKIIGNYQENIVYEDSFTPVTIERYTGKSKGAVYGSPDKIKDGRTEYENLYIAGTDQGFLGIVGSMLSGVTIINQHIL